MRAANLFIKKSLPLLAFLCIASFGVYGQNSVGINTSTPNSRAVLELVSPNNNQGFLVPRLTTAQRNAMTSAMTGTDRGMMVYDTDLNQFWHWNGSIWKAGLGVLGETAAGGDLQGIFPNPTIRDNAVGGPELTDVATNVGTFGAANDSTVLEVTVDADGRVTSVTEKGVKVGTLNILDASILNQDIALSTITISRLNAEGNTDKVLATDPSGIPYWEDQSAFTSSALAEGSVFIGSASGVAEGLPVGGDLTVTNTGTEADFQLGPDAVGSAEIIDGSIDSLDIMPNVIDSTRIADGTVTSADIKNLTIRNEDIANNAINNAKVQRTSLLADRLLGTNADTQGRGIMVSQQATVPIDIPGFGIQNFYVPSFIATNTSSVLVTDANGNVIFEPRSSFELTALAAGNVFIGSSGGTLQIPMDTDPTYGSILVGGRAGTNSIQARAMTGDVFLFEDGRTQIQNNAVQGDDLDATNNALNISGTQLISLSTSRADSSNVQAMELNTTLGGIDINGNQGVAIDAINNNVDITAAAGNVNLTGQNLINLLSNTDIDITADDALDLTTILGVLSITSADALDLQGGATSSFTTTTGDIDINAASQLDLDGQSVVVDATNDVTITGGANLTTNAATGTATLSSTNGEVDITAGSTIDINSQAGNVTIDAEGAGDDVVITADNQVSINGASTQIATGTFQLNTGATVTDITTVIGATGDDSTIPTEKAVRDALNFSVSADNGLTENTEGNIQLGGDLTTANTVITQGAGEALTISNQGDANTTISLQGTGDFVVDGQTGDVIVNELGLLTLENGLTVTSGTVNLGANAIQTAEISDDAITTDKLGTLGAPDANKVYITDGTGVPYLEDLSVFGTTTLSLGEVYIGTAGGAATTLDASGDGFFLIGDGTTVNSVDVTGDIDISNTGDAQIQAGAVTTVEIFDGTISTADIAAGAVTSNEIANATIATADIANDAITSVLIADGEVANADIANDAVTTDKLGTVGAGDANKVYTTDASGNPQLESRTNFATSLLPEGNIFIGNAGSMATPVDVSNTPGQMLIADGTTLNNVTISGDININSAGVVQITSGAVTTTEILDGTIGTTDIAAGAVTTNEIANGTIATADIANDAITNVLIADDAITTTEILDGTISTVDIADDAVSSDKIADGTIGSIDLANNAVTTLKINNDAVTTDKLGTAGVTDANKVFTTDTGGNPQLEDRNNFISSSLPNGQIYIGDGSSTAVARTLSGDATISNTGVLTISPNAITSTEISDRSIAAIDIGTNVITANEIAPDGVGNSELASNSVGSDEVIDNSLTADDINTGAITTDEILNLTIATVDIADDAITNAKIADNAVGTNQISANAVTNAKIFSDAITTDKILDGTITTLDIATSTILTDDIADNAITAAKIANDAVAAAEIADDAVGTPEILNDAVTLAKIANGLPNQILATDGTGNPVYINQTDIVVGTASDLVASSSVVNDSEVDNDLTIDGGTIDNTPIGGTGRSTGNFTNLDASGTLNVSGATTTNGLTNTGNLGTGTLSTSGAATLNSAGVTNNLTVGGVTQLDGTNGLQFDGGQNVNDISTATDLGGGAASDANLSTQLAIKTYVDNQVGSQDLQEAYVDGNTITTSAAEGDVVITGTEQLVVSTTNGVDVTNNATIGGTLDVTGNTSLSTLSTSGTATLDNTSVTNNATVGGTLGVTGNTSLSTLSTSGTATLDNTSITNNASVGGTLGVTGNTSLSTVTTSGAATLNSADVTNNLTVGGVTQLDGTNGLQFDGGQNVNDISTATDLGGGAASDANLSTQLAIKTYVDNQVGSQDLQEAYIDGNTITTSAAEGDVVITGTEQLVVSTTNGVDVTNNAAIGGTLDVTGNTSLSTLSTSGTATLDNTSVTNNATVGGTLGVTGNTSLSTLSTSGTATLDNTSITNNATVGGTLDVSGATTTNGLTNTGNIGTGTLSTTGAATLNSAGVTNNLTVGGVTQLDGTNGLQFDGGTNVTDISTATDLGGGAASDANLSTQLAIKTYVDNQVGSQDLQEAYVDGNTITTSAAEGDVVITGTEQLVVSTTNGVDVTNNATIGGTLDVTGNTSLSTLSTSGTATLDNTSVTNNATVGGTLGVTGNTSLSTLSTSGTATLDNTSITNNATVGGTLGVTGNTSLSTVTTSGAATLNSADVTNNLTVGGVTQLDGTNGLQFDGGTNVTDISTATDLGGGAASDANLSTQLAIKTYVDNQVGSQDLQEAYIDGNTITTSAAEGDVVITGTEQLVVSTTNGVDVTNNATIGGTLDVTGNTSLTTLSTSGTATLDNTSVTNNATVGGTLGVTGNTSLSTLSTSGTATLDNTSITNNATVGGTLGVTGNTSLSTVTTSGAATLNSADVTNNLTVGGVTQLDGTNGLQFDGGTNVTDISTATDLGGGAASDANLSTQLAIKTYVDNQVGSQDLQEAYIDGNTITTSAAEGDVVITGTEQLVVSTTNGVDVTNNATIGGTLDVTGNTSLSTLSTSGTATLDNTSITNNATVGGTLGVTGNTSLSTLSTSGTATLDNTSITNNATVGGTLDVSGATTTNGLTNTGNLGTGTLSTSGAATLNSAGVTNNLTVGGVTQLDGTNGLQFDGGTNVTDISTATDLGGGAASDANLSTQLAIKTYVDNQVGSQDLQEAYIDGNTITTSAAEGDVVITGTEQLVVSTTNGVDVTNNAAIGGTLDVTGNTSLSTLSTSGTATLDNTSVTNNATVGGTLGVTGNTSLSTLSTSGTATLDNTSITNNATVGGTLDVSGATTTNGLTNTGNIGTGTLSTTGAATLNSAGVTNNLTVGGVTQLDGTNGLQFDGGTNVTDISTATDLGGGAASDANLSTQLAIKTYVDNQVGSQDLQEAYIDGNTITTSAAEGDVVITGTEQLVVSTTNGVDVTNNATIGGTLDVTGNTSLTTLSTSGTATLDNTSVTNNATVGGTLGVTGNTSLSTLSTSGTATLDNTSITNNATVGGTLDVSGATTTNGLTNTGNIGTGTLSTTGAATLNSAGVTNNLTVGGVTQLDGTNGLQFDGGTNVTDISTATDLGGGAASDANLSTQLAIKTYVDNQVGSQDLQEAYIDGNTITTSAAEGDVVITGTEQLVVSTTNGVDVTNNAAIGGTLDVTGNTSLSTLSTSGTATLDNTSVTNNATVGGTLGVTGNTSLSTLSTSGTATLDNTSITNNASVGGTLDVTGATTTNGLTNTGNVGTGTLSTTGAATLNSASVTNNATVGGTLTLASGASADEFSTDGTLAGNSDSAIPTEQAVKTYVDNQVGSQDLQEAYIDGNTITTSAAEGDVVITGTEQLVVSTTNGVDVTNNATIGGTLDVTGNTSLSTLSTSGTATLDNTSVTNNATVGGTLGVTGNTSLSTLSTSGTATLDNTSITNNATVGGTLGVTGNTSLSTVTTSGAATLNSADVTNNLTVGGVTQLDGTNGLQFDGGTNVTDISTATDLGGGAASDANLSTQLAIKTYVDNQVGAISVSLQDAYDGGQSIITDGSGPLSVTGTNSISLTSSNDVAGAISLESNTGTSGTITLTNTAGTASGAIRLDAQAGGVEIDAALNNDITLTTSGTGRVIIPLTEISGGTIDNTVIGGSTPATGTFTNVSANQVDVGNLSLSGNVVSSTNTDGNITFTPDGTGSVVSSSNFDALGGIDVTGNITVSGDVDGRDISDLGTNVDNLILLSGQSANAANLGTFTGDIISDNNTITGALQELETDLDAVQTLTGVNDGDTDLGTFTGVTISDNTTIKGALQELESVVESGGGVVASAVGFTPAGSIAANNVQAAIEELDNEKLALTGGTITGDLTIGDGALGSDNLTINANLSVVDNYFRIIDDGDPTKQVGFFLGDLPTGYTNIYRWPNVGFEDTLVATTGVTLQRAYRNDNTLFTQSGVGDLVIEGTERMNVSAVGGALINNVSINNNTISTATGGMFIEANGSGSALRMNAVGNIDIANNNSIQFINIGAGAAAKTISMGNTGQNSTVAMSGSVNNTTNVTATINGGLAMSPSIVTLTVDGATLDPNNRTVIEIVDQENGNTNFTLATGNKDGHILVLFMASSVDPGTNAAIQLDNGGNQKLNGNWGVDADEEGSTITLMWSATLGQWLELSRSINP